MCLACVTGPLLAQGNKAPVVPESLPHEVKPMQAGVSLTLLAEHPDLVTPTGIDVDDQGQLWVVACHTHFRPETYTGPEHDEVLVFDAQGKNRRVFYNKTDATMQVELGRDGWVYLAERDRILRVKDADGDGVGDIEENLATLDTLADYPHNGLSGMAWHPDGGLVFSLGENFGQNWTLTARDGSLVRGRGEGGVFRCADDGTKMRRIARGFWNPFGLVVRQDGEIFAAENDPGSRPPCRLLHVVEGADYGFQWVYGSAAVHPFVAWNGELRGTIGMIHPVGEGPSAAVELGGGFIVPSWSNHTLDYFPLSRKGAGYTSQQIEIVRGGEHFRPVCMAPGPDGAFYLTDWVFSSYQLHARGRLWRLEIDRKQADWIKPEVEPMNDAARLAKELREDQRSLTMRELFVLARGSDSYLTDAALTALARASQDWTPESVKLLPLQDRIWALVALRRVDLQEEKWVRALINDIDPEVRFECLRWIADGVLTSFQADVERLLAQPLEFRLFEAALAASNTLKGNPGAGVTDPTILAEHLTSEHTPPRTKAFALRLAPPSHPKITLPLLGRLMSLGDPLLTQEVVRTLASRPEADALDMLSTVAIDDSLPSQLRAEAVVGLAGPVDQPRIDLLLRLAHDPQVAVREEALRGLRLSSLNEESRQTLTEIAGQHGAAKDLVSAILDKPLTYRDRPAIEDTTAWLQRLAAVPGQVDAEAGRRIFFHSKLSSCSNCHRYDGRGNVVGPDLSLIAKQGDPAAILRSILQPNRDVAPQYYSTMLELADGSLFSGMLLRSSSTEVFRDTSGRERVFQKSDIVQRKELKTSLMPTDLVALLTDREIRDLLSFLTSPVSELKAR